MLSRRFGKLGLKRSETIKNVLLSRKVQKRNNGKWQLILYYRSRREI